MSERIDEFGRQVRFALLGKDPWAATGIEPNSEVQRQAVFNERRVVLFCGGLQSGKALDIETPIPTVAGWKRMGDIAVGDRVFGLDGKPYRVCYATEAMTGHPCYRVEFQDRTSVICDAEHLWQVETPRIRKSRCRSIKTMSQEMKTTEEMASDFSYICLTSGKKRYRYSLSICSPIQYKKKTLLIDPYVLGVWLGDGTSTSGEITIAENELLSLMGRPAKEMKRCGNRTPDYKVEGLYSELKRLNLLNNKHLPKEYLLADVDQRLLLLRGLMDTDGTVGERGHCEFTSARLSLAKGVLELVRSLGIKTRISDGRAKLYGKDCGPKYRILFTPSIQVFRLPRKAEKLERCIEKRIHSVNLRKDRHSKLGRNGKLVSAYPQNKRLHIRNIEQVPSIPVKCIEVDSPDHLYLCSESFLPTHNTLAGAHRVGLVVAREPNHHAMVMRQALPDLTATTAEALAWVLWRIVDPTFKKDAANYESLKQLPKDFAKFRDKEVPHLTLLYNGSVISFRHLQAAAGLGSYIRGIIWIDEASQISKQEYETACHRTSQIGVTQQLFLSTNPPREARHWIDDEFLAEVDDDDEANVLLAPFNRSRIGISQEANWKNLEPSYIKQFEGLSENDKRWRIHGKLGSVFGVGTRVFPEFSRAAHVSKIPLSPWEGRPIIQGLDVGAVGNQIGCLAFSIGREGQRRILREWYEEGIGIATFGKMVLMDCQLAWPGWTYRVGIDPNSANTRSWTDERSAMMVLQEIGFGAHGGIQLGASSQTGRREVLGDLLKTMVNGEPAVQIDPSCRMLIGALDGGYTFDPKSMKGVYSHIIDAWGYGETGPAQTAMVLDSSRRRAEMPRPTYAVSPKWIPAKPQRGVIRIGKDSGAHDFGR